MTNTSNIVVGSRAIHGVPLPTAKVGNKVLSYQGANNTVTDAQYALVSAGQAGTDGVLNGVQLAGGREITVNDVDGAGNAAGTVYAGPFGTWSKPANTGPGVFDINLGTPIDESANNILASTAITALPITGAKLDVGRVPTLTGNALSASVIAVSGVDMEGEPLTVNYTLNGTNLITGTKAFGPSVALSFAVVTPHTGDTFSCGVSDILGLPVRLDNRGAVAKGATVFGTTVEATDPTITVDASVLCNNTILLNSDLDGSHAVIVNGIRSDATLPEIIQ